MTTATFVIPVGLATATAPTTLAGSQASALLPGNGYARLVDGGELQVSYPAQPLPSGAVVTAAWLRVGGRQESGSVGTVGLVLDAPGGGVGGGDLVGTLNPVGFDFPTYTQTDFVMEVSGNLRVTAAQVESGDMYGFLYAFDGLITPHPVIVSDVALVVAVTYTDDATATGQSWPLSQTRRDPVWPLRQNQSTRR